METTERDAILNGLERLINQRSGMVRADYIDPYCPSQNEYESFKSDQKRFAQDGRDARRLLRYVRMRPTEFNSELLKRMGRSGRLTYRDGEGWEYVAYQIEGLEIRSSVARYLADCIRHSRLQAGEWSTFRSQLLKTFGRGIGERYF